MSDATISPSRKQTALKLTCAIVSNPNIMEFADPELAADEALRLLNYLEKKLRVAQTAHRPEE